MGKAFDSPAACTFYRGSVHVNELVQAHQGLAEVGQCQFPSGTRSVAGGGVAGYLLADERDAVGLFLLCWRAAHGDFVGGAGGGCGGRRVGGGGALGQGLGVLAHLGVVHQQEGLGGDGRGGALAHGGQGFGGVEDDHHGDQVAALYREVDAAALRGGVEGAGAVHFCVEHSGDGEHRVADRLGFESADGATPEELVVGVGGGLGGVEGAVGPVGGAEHDLLLQGLETPVVFDQRGREVVEEFGVRGRGAARAEVAGCGDDAAADVVLPEPVGGDAGGE